MESHIWCLSHIDIDTGKNKNKTTILHNITYKRLTIILIRNFSDYLNSSPYSVILIQILQQTQWQHNYIKKIAENMKNEWRLVSSKVSLISPFNRKELQDRQKTNKKETNNCGELLFIHYILQNIIIIHEIWYLCCL